jgi:hypothetical protein
MNGEVIFPIGIHVFEPCRREMRQIVFLHRVVFGTELVQRRLHIHRIPDDHGVRDEIEAPRLVGPNLAKGQILAKYNTVNQSDRLPGGTKPAHAVRE